MTTMNGSLGRAGVIETLEEFNPVLEAYASGNTDDLVLADEMAARSIIPPGRRQCAISAT